MREDWTTLLTEEERKVLARAYTALERSVAQANPWYRRSPARAKAIVSAYQSLAASRALVAEKDKVLQEQIELSCQHCRRGIPLNAVQGHDLRNGRSTWCRALHTQMALALRKRTCVSG